LYEEVGSLLFGIAVTFRAQIVITDAQGTTELDCYSDSLHCVNFIKGLQVKFHIYAVLIQDIKELLSQTNVSLHRTLREENQCVYFFAKLEASSDADFLTYASPLKIVRNLLKNDATGTLFLCE
jgi:hypothetical protein